MDVRREILAGRGNFFLLIKITLEQRLLFKHLKLSHHKKTGLDHKSALL